MGGKIDRYSYRRRTYTAVFGFAAVAGMFSFNFQLVRVQGHSMDPTYHNGQWLLVRRMTWPPPPLRVGDVIVFRKDNDLLVKRIAALGGQEIPDREETLVTRPSHKHPGVWETAVVFVNPGKVPPGQIYVLGDNAQVSDDSRSFGPVPVSTLIGRVLRWREPGRPPTQAELSAARGQ